MSPDEPTDVCLLLEGTYPYIRGGVSSWVHQMLGELPDMTFSLMFIGSRKEFAKEYLYDIPENVKRIEEIFIFELFDDEEKKPVRADRQARQILYSIQEDLYLEPQPWRRIQLFWQWLDMLDTLPSGMTYGNLVRDEEAWEMLQNVVEKYFRNEPFTDVFYTYLFLHGPLWKLLRARHRVPAARAYHTLCTGYAGMLGSIAARTHGAPLLVSEHGVYVKERIEEINQAKWIHDPITDHINLERDQSALKRAWIEMFKFQAYLAYQSAHTITTLFARNKQLQVELGAPEKRLTIIPNGISPRRFAKAREARLERLKAETPMTVGFVGRVVSIKDVKTLIRAIAFAKDKFPQILLRIIGPTDEEPDYYEECLALVDMLEVGAHITFTGRQNVLEVISDIDVMVLTSVSEGLPFVILEGYAAEIPSVATDVGSCRELIFGATTEDRQIGAGGYLTKVASPEQTANALVDLLRDPELLARTGRNGYERLQRFYREDEVMNTYRKLYQELANNTAEAGQAAPPLTQG